MIAKLPAATRHRLDDSGIAGTRVHYRYDYDSALWLASHYADDVEIHWDDMDDETRLDELLAKLVESEEEDFYDSGYVSCREWMALSANGRSDFAWLWSQLKPQKRYSRFWAGLYDAADIPVIWKLGNARASRSRNVFTGSRVVARTNGLRRPPLSSKQEIQEPLTAIKRLSQERGREVIDVAMASLATMHRETLHFEHANPDEVYLADAGEGVSIAVMGLLPGQRFPLECTMGYLILANGVPVGYGGGSVLFRQLNTGLNIFSEYRGSEAAFLWLQVLRVFHQMFACERFIINPYQFGQDNREALSSGAFWFHYRLGFRPVEKEVRQLARSEWLKIKSRKTYQTPARILRQLAGCDMHLALAGARMKNLFREEWIECCSLAATQTLASQASPNKRAAKMRVANKLLDDLWPGNRKSWGKSEYEAFRMMAPVVATIDFSDWSKQEKQSLLKLMHAKGGRFELDFAQQFCEHEKFFRALQKLGRQLEKFSPYSQLTA
ncbi:MAG: hypothetical protein IIA76_03850 [Proteobacteria bacterium]|nr:hypothetical protein [Pseudomonadota bacterium]